MKKFLCVLAAVMAVFVWSAGAFGEIPPGLEFRTAKLYENGVTYSDWNGRIKASLYGTPAQAGKYTFTVFVWDDALGGVSENQAEKTFTVTITWTSTNTNTGTNTNYGITLLGLLSAAFILRKSA